jgi:fido (protein-threonine AMPylation protein)
VTFDPFGDFDSRGYLHNFPGFKDIAKIKALEHASFQINLDRAINTLAAVDFIEYKHVLAVHKILFGDVYDYLRPFMGDAIERQQSMAVLKSLKGLRANEESP